MIQIETICPEALLFRLARAGFAVLRPGARDVAGPGPGGSDLHDGFALCLAGAETVQRLRGLIEPDPMQKG